jgi:hypothetical protein
MCGELIWIIDKVVTDQYRNSIWVIFLGAVVDDSSCVCDNSIFWDASDFIWGEVKNHVGDILS